MVLDHDIEEIINDIGHDGSEVVWPNQKDPLKRRGFHPQELCLYTLKSGYMLGQFDLAPICAPDLNEVPYTLRGMGEHVATLMQRYEGLLFGIGAKGMMHCVAWDREEIFDPNGTVYTIDKFLPHIFMPLLELRI